MPSAGADHAFECGALQARGAVEVYLPSAGFSEHLSLVHELRPAAFEIATTVPRLDVALGPRAAAARAERPPSARRRSAVALQARGLSEVGGAEVSRETGGSAMTIVVVSRDGVRVCNLARDGRCQAAIAHRAVLYCAAK